VVSVSNPVTEPLSPPGICRALIVDDDPEAGTLLQTRLQNREFDVEIATSGEEALARLRTDPPDIIFLDVSMPGMDGLEVLASVREQNFDLAVIMTTAMDAVEVAIEALRLGADDYLRKPFDSVSFQHVLDRTVRRLQLSRQNAALWNRIGEQRRQLDKELARAAEMQADLLPPSYPRIPGFEVAAMCLAAREVGGDFYDWQQLPSGMLSLTVGDVMGKGISAALLMATTRAVLRALVTENSPVDAVQRTARALDSDLTRSGAFVTLFHCQLDVNSGNIRFVDAGHGYVVLRRADGSVEEMQPWGLPLGVDSTERYREGVTHLAPGDTLIVFSDGLAEACPDLFNDRLTLAALAGRSPDAGSLVRDLIERATQVMPLPDDLTVVVLRRPVSAFGNG
jgi:sigma-B regulation protein RsbU (phosphoserine phosphatase)